MRTEQTQNVVAAWSQLEAARAQLQSDRVAVESNKVALQGVREEEKVGQRTLLDVLNADFVRTARSKGMSERRVVTRHVMRNALVLVVTTVGLQFGSLMGQAVVVEKLFSWPGVGSLLIDSVFQRDIPTVQGCILMIVMFFLLINTLVDLAYVVIDPRIRYG